MKKAGFVRCAALGLPAALLLTGCNAPRASNEAVKEPGVAAQQASPELKPAQPATSHEAGRGRNETTSGMVVYIDPATGEILRKPQASAPGVPQAAKTKTVAPELYEVPSPAPGGGSMVDLKGQFLSPLVGTVGPDGKLTVEHEPRPLEMVPTK